MKTNSNSIPTLEQAMQLVQELCKEGWSWVAMDWIAATNDNGDVGYQVTFFRKRQGIRNRDQAEAVEFSLALAIQKAYLTAKQV